MCKVLKELIFTTPSSLTMLKYCTLLWILTFKNYFRIKVMAKNKQVESVNHVWFAFLADPADLSLTFLIEQQTLVALEQYSMTFSTIGF